MNSMPSIRSLMSWMALAALWLTPGPCWAQDALTLDGAIRQALQGNAGIRAARAGEGEAEARQMQVRGPYLPQVSFLESWQKGNQPVYVFGGLLNQRRFTSDDFDLDRLNHPEALGNFRAAFVVDQVVFDGPRRGALLRSAALGREMAAVGTSQVESEVVLATTEAYGRVLTSQVERRSTEAAVSSAEADLRLAEHRRDAGVATEADALAVQVHLAQVRERQIRARAHERIARLGLNRLMGVALDRQYELDPAPAPLDPADTIEVLETEALASRPDVKRAVLAESLAHAAHDAAKSAWYPQIAVQGAWELTGARFADRANAWLVGAHIRFNLFSGFGDVGRLREADHARTRVAAEREQIETAVRVEVRTVLANLEAARAREVVGEAAVTQARESQRIVRDRYEAGLATVNDILRAANARLDAELQQTAARIDVLVSRAALDRAVGRTP